MDTPALSDLLQAGWEITFKWKDGLYMGIAEAKIDGATAKVFGDPMPSISEAIVSMSVVIVRASMDDEIRRRYPPGNPWFQFSASAPAPPRSGA